MATGSPVQREEHREPGSIEEEPPIDEVFTLLSNRRRRHAVEYLRRCEDTVDLGELAEVTAARENGMKRVEISSAERKRTYTALQQFHLPKMEKMEFVTYERQRGIVKPTDRLKHVDSYLKKEADTGREWGYYYGLASALAVALAGLGWLGTVPLLAVVGSVVVAFGVLSVVHTASAVGFDVP